MHLPNGDVFPFETCHLIIAAGAESGHIANLAGMGIGKVIFFYDDKKKYLFNFFLVPIFSTICFSRIIFKFRFLLSLENVMFTIYIVLMVLVWTVL